jgi:hypothetical protein
MQQRGQGPTSGKTTAADTAAHAFPATPAIYVILRAGPANAGTVTILGKSPDGALPADGIPLAAGEYAPPIGPVTDLATLGYQFDTVNDVLHHLVVR